jgi:hypothetical protein
MGIYGVCLDCDGIREWEMGKEVDITMCLALGENLNYSLLVYWIATVLNAKSCT